MAKAHTTAEVERIVEDWHAGIGPDQLHDALGWTWEEYKLYTDAEGGRIENQTAEDVLASFAPKDEVMGRAWADFPAGADVKINWLKNTAPFADFVKVDFSAERVVSETWHVAPLPGQDRWIVRSTFNGIARIAPAPNDFHSPDAARRRAAQLNEETP